MTSAAPAAASNCDDYALVKRALEMISESARAQPSVEEIAGAVGLSASYLRALFQRWAGLSPKAFLQAVTLDRAKTLLRNSATLLDAAYEVGLSGPGRLHDLFVAHEAMTPGDFKAGGAGLTLLHGFHPSPFGEAILVVAPRGLAALGFVDGGDRGAALRDLLSRWPNAEHRRDDGATAPFARRAFDSREWRPDRPLRIVFIGSDFEIRVWRCLLRIPMGQATTYGAVAQAIGRPRAARAVGAAVGRNPISFVVPCHRVLGGAGALTGYHWGLTRKRAMIGWEAGRVLGDRGD